MTQTLPTCFVSYCHDNADVRAIDLLITDVERIAKGKFRIVRDKENISWGQSIEQHERLLDTCEAAIVLFTPEYLNKIRNRQGGVHREYGVIYDRYTASLEDGLVAEDDDDLPKPPQRPPFTFLPILFAGTKATSMPDEVSDSLYRDFTQYRVHRDNHGAYSLSDSVRRKFEAGPFSELSAAFTTAHTLAKRAYAKSYIQKLSILFSETKHEVLRRKQGLSGGEQFLDTLFVKTHVYKKVIDQTICIIVGRKGSGKSTIIDHFLNSDGKMKHMLINVHLKDFDFTLLYNVLFSSRNSRDIGTLITYQRFWEAVWVLFIYRRIGALVGVEQDARAKQMPLFESSSRDHVWADYVDVVQMLLDYTVGSVDATKGDAKFYGTLADRLRTETLIEGLVGRTQFHALAKAVRVLPRRFLFGLDGFDLRFEDFRNQSLLLPADDPERATRNNFEVAWLKGLLRCVLDLRSADSVVQDRMDFCVSIPQDRYMEARELERDDYRLRALSAEVRWSGIELAILLRKRFEVLFDLETTPHLRPLDRLNQALGQDGAALPLDIDVSVGRNVVKMSLVKYLLRHTFWRPRDLLYYVASILTMQSFLTKTGRKIDNEIVKEVVAKTTLNVIGTEFLKEFKKGFVNVEDVVKTFRGADVIMNITSLRERLKKVDFVVSGGQAIIRSAKEKVDMLYEIGFLGIENRSRGPGDPTELFYFSDGDREYKAMSDEELAASNFVIHPIFVEYLRLSTAKFRILCVYSDEYLERNDLTLAM